VIAVSTTKMGGKVAYIGDSNVFDNTFLYQFDNKQVLLSLVRWLASTCVKIPDIDVDPLSYDIAVEEGSSTTRLLNISNTGSADLTFGINDTAAWLSELPISGTVVPGITKNIVVTFSALSLSPGVYNASIIISSNDYDENPANVPVILTVRQKPLQPIYVKVSESPDPVPSGGTSQVTVLVTTTGGAAVSGANVSVSATGGSLSPVSGSTDASGNFISTYTAPYVNITMNYSISATAAKTGYTNGSGSDPITVNPQSCNQPWDVNMDGKVNVQDLVLVGQHFGQPTSPPYPRWDVNQDGKVNVQDLVIVGQHFGQTTCYLQ